jgi:hypothetical protein
MPHPPIPQKLRNIQRHGLAAGRPDHGVAVMHDKAVTGPNQPQTILIDLPLTPPKIDPPETVIASVLQIPVKVQQRPEMLHDEPNHPLLSHRHRRGNVQGGFGQRREAALPLRLPDEDGDSV